jgi:hypothetical protein
MPQLKSREVKEICFSNLRRYFDGEITREELDQKVNEVEKQIASGEATIPTLFDQNERKN